MDFEEKKKEVFVKAPAKKLNTIVIDNGTFEIKVGFKNDPCFIANNKIYKSKNRNSFEVYPSSTRVGMFDRDVVVNFDISEMIFTNIFKQLKLGNVKGKELVLTTTPNSPTNEDFVDFLFQAFNFSKIHIYYDFLATYNKYFGNKNGLVVSISHSNTFVAFLKDGEIKFIQKLPFGGEDLLSHIKQNMQLRFRDFRSEYAGLIEHVRVATDYKEETHDILQRMYTGDYSKVLFLQEEQIEEELVEQVKKIKKTNLKRIEIPEINYSLFELPDNDCTRSELAEKRRGKLLYHSTLARIKHRTDQVLKSIQDVIDDNQEELEKMSDMKGYIERKKKKFEQLKRDLKDRDNLRKNAKNKRSVEFAIKSKEVGLTEEEIDLQERIAAAEDSEMEDDFIYRVNELANEIKELEPEFIPFYASTLEILRGDNIGRPCLSTELVKWGEVFFNPSILNIPEMGLSEILENVAKAFPIERVLITGGLSKMVGIKERIYKELICRSKTGDIEIKVIEDTQKDLFDGIDGVTPITTYENPGTKNK